MKVRELLQTTAHRPWELPEENWKFYQEWNEAIFLHWNVDKKVLRNFVPQALELDLFQGQPWVSVVIFKMENIRLRGLPPFPPISNFHEINIRTYVKNNGKSGVYFLSIEAGNPISCALAKTISKLPYRYSKMARNKEHFSSSNDTFSDHLALTYHPSGKLRSKSDLDIWLTERYALFQDSGNHLNAFEIHHVEWPIQALELASFSLDYPRFYSLIDSAPHAVHYSPGVQVVAWNKTSQLIN